MLAKEPFFKSEMTIHIIPWDLYITSFFRGKLKGASIFTSNARVVLISRVQIREDLIKTFSITMGYGKNMLEEDALEEDFGLKVVLNTITPSSLRRINKVTTFCKSCLTRYKSKQLTATSVWNWSDYSHYLFGSVPYAFLFARKYKAPFNVQV